MSAPAITTTGWRSLRSSWYALVAQKRGRNQDSELPVTEARDQAR